jgi:hypothetical protein
MLPETDVRNWKACLRKGYCDKSRFHNPFSGVPEGRESGGGVSMNYVRPVKSTSELAPFGAPLKGL